MRRIDTDEEPRVLDESQPRIREGTGETLNYLCYVKRAVEPARRVRGSDQSRTAEVRAFGVRKPGLRGGLSGGDRARRGRNDRRALPSLRRQENAVHAVAEEIEAEILAAIARTLPKTDDAWALVTYAVTETLALAAQPGIASVIFRDAPNVIGATAWREIEMRYGYGQLHALLRRLATAGRLGGHDPAIVAGVILGAWMQTAEATLASAHPAEALRAGQAAMLALLSGFKSEPA